MPSSSSPLLKGPSATRPLRAYPKLSDATLAPMLLSLRHKFIFIHIYKAAGTSVTHALRPFTREPFLRRRTVPRLPDHITAAELRETIGVLFDDCFKFTFVR